FEPAASRRSVLRERCDQSIPTRTKCMPDLCDVTRTIRGVGEEVKHGPVVPEIEGVGWERIREDVSFTPRDRRRPVGKALLRLCESSSGDIQHGDAVISRG